MPLGIQLDLKPQGRDKQGNQIGKGWPRLDTQKEREIGDSGEQVRDYEQ